MRAIFTGLLAIAGLTAASALQALGGEYPERPVSLIVPAPTGGGTDIFARGLARMVEPTFGQKIVIDNKAGGGGALGVTHLVAARPDGYTVAFVWNSPLTATPHHLTVPYSPDQYRTVMSIGYSSYVLCAPSTLQVSGAKDFVRYLKANSGKLSYGNDGSGGTMQLAAERLFTRIGANLRGIPHSGAGDTARALLGGQINLYGGSLPPILPHVASGKVKCHLLTSAGRNAALPETDGLDAIDLANEETVLWWGLLVPVNTPNAVVARLEKEFSIAAMSDEFKALLDRQGAVRRVLDGADTNRLLKQEFHALSDIARTVGLQRRM